VKVDSILSLAGLIVIGAIAYTAVSSPNTSAVIRAVGDTWKGSLQAITPAK
jgi:hypothetical protein